ncbi:hypothetical protein [Mesobacillus zeae]|uniref:Uncharacterized protein n=1 Tax=Mesobacillus zeae TaxID=1917180 RepID=A0A398BB04_9BACI|nr:hypothetical protein [Mesobacillus zeae]RID85040.1 hypothetical protein D1970_10770 [Mesobacillus zeae]
MKANINLEISKEDLNYELENLVSQIASEQIGKLVKEKAESMVEQEVKRIIAPIVDSYLQTIIVGEEDFSYHCTKPRRTDVDTYIKKTLQKYLDEPCYKYSKTSNTLSGRYMKSSPSGDKTTRAEHWIMDKTREYADNELFQKIDKRVEETVKSVIPNEEEIQEIIKREIQAKFNA